MSSELKFSCKNTYNKEYSIQKHTHPCYELVYYLEGEGSSSLDDYDYRFTKGTFVIVAPEQIHSESSLKGANVHFIGFESTEKDIRTGIYQDKEKFVLHVLNSIDKEMKGRKPYYHTMLNLLVEEIILLAKRITPTAASKNTNFEYIINYFKMNANKNITIQQISTNLGYNYDYLRQLFISKVNMSAKKYFNNLKLQNVKKYLTDTDYNIKEIADITGFSSASHLCMVFKEETDISPEQFRKTAKQSTTQVENNYKINYEK